MMKSADGLIIHPPSFCKYFSIMWSCVNSNCVFNYQWSFSTSNKLIYFKLIICVPVNNDNMATIFSCFPWNSGICIRNPAFLFYCNERVKFLSLATYYLWSWSMFVRTLFFFRMREWNVSRLLHTNSEVDQCLWELSEVDSSLFL